MLFSLFLWCLMSPAGEAQEETGQRVAREALPAFPPPLPAEGRRQKSAAAATPGSPWRTLPRRSILPLTHSCVGSGGSRLRGREGCLGGTHAGTGARAAKNQSPLPGTAAIHPRKNRAMAFAALEANAETLERFNSLNSPRVMEMLSSPV